MHTIEKANTYIEFNKNCIRKEYRNDYHMAAPIGWINDPNGFIHYKGEYHLFYQYYPYDAQWGPMHWGHAKSKDLISWEDVPVALAPDQPYDKDGCFSGTAIEKDGKMYVMYTGHILGETEDDIRQVQCMAVSSDGIHFEKVEQNPVIDETYLPENAVPQDFRDPKLIKKGSHYYSLIASKSKEGVGQILLYKSESLIDWEFVSIMLAGEKNKDFMWECPDLFEIDGKDVLIISVDGLPEDKINFSNTHSVISVIGKMDWEKGVFHKEKIEEVDYGLDFYAPQTLLDDKGRRIMVAWMQMWGRNIPTETEKHGWAGAMTLPRELSIKNNHLYQKPVREIRNYYTHNKNINNLKLINQKKEFTEFSTDVGVLELKLDTKAGKRLELEIRSNGGEKTIISYDCHSGLLELNRKDSGIELIGKEKNHVYKRSAYCDPKSNRLDLEIFLDKSSIEVFVNDGECTMTSTIYPKKKADKISIATEGEIEIKSFNKWDIEV